MTDAERVLALQAFRYTARQSQFLLRVALHSGYFLRRQYVGFIGRGHGLATTRFLAGTVSRGHVQIVPARRHGHLFHLFARPVYAALDQEDNRHRRQAAWAAVIRKLLTLDFVLSQPDAQFIATEADKVALLQDTGGVSDERWPSKRYESRRRGGRPTVRYFVDKMPWFRRPTDARLWLTYVNTGDTLAGWETFLIQYRDQLTALLRSGVAYVGLERDARVRAIFDRIIGRPVSRAVPRDSAAFLDYCRIRHRIEAEDWVNLGVTELQRWGQQLRSQFAAARFDALYRRWRVDGDAVLTEVTGLDPRLDCAFEMHRLPHPYDGRPHSVGRLGPVADDHPG
jgi:hypothetical protein